jgi:excisionase family DNA binding protein
MPTEPTTTLSKDTQVTRSSTRDSLPEWLSPTEAMVWLGISRTSIYERLRRRDIPYKRFGRLIRISRGAL